MVIFKKGDIIISSRFPEIEREITRRYKGNKYEWKYVGIDNKYFLSSNSSDPHLETWKLK